MKISMVDQEYETSPCFIQPDFRGLDEVSCDLQLRQASLDVESNCPCG